MDQVQSICQSNSVFFITVFLNTSMHHLKEVVFLEFMRSCITLPPGPPLRVRLNGEHAAPLLPQGGGEQSISRSGAAEFDRVRRKSPQL